MPSVPLRAVTFDCWNTLLHERDTGATYARRVASLVRAVGAEGIAIDDDEARAALDAAWRRHWTLWHEGRASGAEDMAGWAVEAVARARGLSTPPPRAAEAAAATFAEAALGADVAALDGARETLEALAAAGVPMALVCDTGFSPGRVVRRLLDRAGLLGALEVTVFSDEVGAPKPDRRTFETALAGLRLAGPERTLHVGDLRRTDVAGGRGAGMGTVRIRDRHDDVTELADADAIADTHAHLHEILRGA